MSLPLRASELGELSTSEWIALAAAGVALLSWLDSRRAVRREQQHREESIALLRRQTVGEGSAMLVAEYLGPLTEFELAADLPYFVVPFDIRNVGRATARAITVEAVRFADESLGKAIAKVRVPVALDRGERSRVHFELAPEDARRGKLTVVAYWEDDNGAHEKDVGYL